MSRSKVHINTIPTGLAPSFHSRVRFVEWVAQAFREAPGAGRSDFTLREK